MSRHCHGFLAALLVVSLATVAACGGGKSPTSPTPVQAGGDGNPAPAPDPAPGPTGSATITGQVVGGPAPLGDAPLGAGLAGVSVGVVGTSVSARADGDGRFTLSNVPSGNQQLSFTGNGADARLRVDGISERERIELTVAVTGTSAEVVGQERDNGSEAQLEGRIAAVDEGARTLTIGAFAVIVPAGVPIRHGATSLTFANLHVNDRVHVKGSKSGTVVTATEVNVQRGQDTPGGGNGADETVRGAITGVSGACPDRQLTVGAKTVVVNAATRYRQGASCGQLAIGVVIEAEGPGSGNTVTARTLKIEDGPGGGNRPDQTVRGAISGLGGSCPNRTFVVDGTSVLVNGSTQYRRGASCAALANGTIVEVEGPASGGTITARTLALEDGPGGGPADTVLRGVVSGRGGACPSITFTVQGKTVTTSGATQFRKATCEQVVNGTNVEAEGVLTGNTLAAKKVQLED